METSAVHNRIVRFGTFEVDVRSGELRRSGLKIKLQDQPFQLLAVLLERPGDLVTREDIQRRLWPSNTFVDFDLALNAAVKKLRQALNDDAGTPRYIETLPRRGYRFVFPVAAEESLVSRPLPGAGGPAQEHVPAISVKRHGMKVAGWVLMAGIPVVLFLVLIALNFAGLRELSLGKGLTRVFGWPHGATPPTRIESIAVLPLENLSHDPEQEYFADGMTDALTAELATIGALRVISRTSAMEYKGSKKRLTDIARELNVDAVVEGSVMRSRNRVRITAQLIDTARDRHLWAENYERDVGDVVTLQGEVARAIAQEIQVKLTPVEQARLASARPVNPEAHELYLKGRFYWNKLSPDGLKRGLEYFQQAVEKDPNDALAYAGIADCYVFFADADIAPPKEVIPQAKQAVAKALSLDESLAEAHASLAMVKFLYDHEWAAAEKEFKRAIALNPSYSTRVVGYPFYLLAMGRTQEAMAEINRTYSLDPVGLLTNSALGWLLCLTPQYDQAIEQERKTLELFPESDSAALDLAWAYEQKGLFPEALAEYQRAERLSPDTPKMSATLRQGYLKAGAKGYWESKLQLFRAQSKREYVPPYFFAVTYASLGDRDRAMEWLEKEYQEGHDGVVYLKVDPHFDSLRSDPRFQAMVRRMNFPP